MDFGFFSIEFEPKGDMNWLHCPQAGPGAMGEKNLVSVEAAVNIQVL